MSKKNHRINNARPMILVFILVSGICGVKSFTPTDHYLLSCGPSSNSVSYSTFDGRAWSPDLNSTFSSSFSSTFEVTAKPDPSVPNGSPFTAARIFNSSFSYSFPVSPGPKFLRLFFYPTLYSGQYNASQFFISVQANHHLLLRNFSAQLAIDYVPSTVRQNITTDPFVIKEYYVTVPNGGNSIKLTFSPTPPSSYAFVNGIEVVSVPENLYVTDNPVKYIEDPFIPFQIVKSTALETVYRINVGGRDVDAKTDGVISGMYRQWKNDDPYTFLIYGQPEESSLPIKYTERVPNYTAPEQVYQTFKGLDLGLVMNMTYNLTWRFKVDPGFYYLMRLHWCEDDIHMNTTGDREFEVYINNFTAEENMDVMYWTSNQRYVPVYRDYLEYVTGGNDCGSSVDLWIALQPNNSSVYREVLLNGLEIFKLNKSDGSLDAPNPCVHQDSEIPSKPVPTKGQKKGFHIVPVAITGIAVLVLLMLIVCLSIFRYLKGNGESSAVGKSTNKQVCRKFSLAQIRLASMEFNEGLIIGRGGFGNVYKGVVDGDNGPIEVAIKRLNPSSKQGMAEFLTEITLLSELRHVHLVSLIGYCDESEEMILVYEYMERGTLRDHLYNSDNPLLTWSQRLHACIGAAKGLHYLHSGQTHTIIHRDVKSTNILLDEKWVSKVSDFGISKLRPTEGDLSHVSTVVKGSFGYLDPEYYKTQRLTEKSDVYSFGVVLFEALCGRAALDPILINDHLNLALWAQSYQRKGALSVIVDPNIKGEIAPACSKEFGEIAERCVRKHGKERPSMADVVMSLELALELQHQASITSNESIFSNHGVPLSNSESTLDEHLELLLPPETYISKSTSHGEDITNKTDA